MSGSVSIQYIGYLGAALGVCMVMPQIARTYRNRSLGGVSVLSWALSGLSSFTWLLYGIRVAEIPQIPGNVLTISGAVLIALAVPSPTGRKRRGLAIAIAACALIALTATVPATSLGLIAFGLGIVSMLPQTVRSLRRTTGGISAVSIPTWVLFGASQACWLVYALVVHDLVVATSACWIMVSSLVISASELRQRRGLAPRVRAGGEPRIEDGTPVGQAWPASIPPAQRLAAETSSVAAPWRRERSGTDPTSVRSARRPVARRRAGGSAALVPMATQARRSPFHVTGRWVSTPAKRAASDSVVVAVLNTSASSSSPATDVENLRTAPGGSMSDPFRDG